VYAVEEWRGHDKLSTTQGYIQFAQNYNRNASYDWIKTIFKSNNQFKECIGEDNGLISKQGENEGVLTGIPHGDAVGSRQVSLSFAGFSPNSVLLQYFLLCFSPH